MGLSDFFSLRNARKIQYLFDRSNVPQKENIMNTLFLQVGEYNQGRLQIDNWGGGAIFIYSCSTQLISFEIVI